MELLDRGDDVLGGNAEHVEESVGWAAARQAIDCQTPVTNDGRVLPRGVAQTDSDRLTNATCCSVAIRRM